MRRPTAGFTMVEVLVAVLLLAVGLVGALAMQAYAMRTRQETALQNEALQAAASLADRIRANAAQSSSYLGFDSEAPPAPAAPGTCTDTPCDTSTLAARELDEFRQHLSASLPGARASVCRDAAASGGALQWACSGSPDATIVIKVGWRSRQPAYSATNTAPQLVLPVALPAVPAPPSAGPTLGGGQ
ncbi:type IV pilus modification protein PilV [Pseudoduganella sp. OTU4001]|uniref:type IV pilus modification protein PilV n=1 Tax=Pseudoduganella sp. OTU4001 TaxID=3043854 RepID=UPI00313C8781